MILRKIYFYILCLITIPGIMGACDEKKADEGVDYIQPSPDNPFYWQYKGKPILLLGGTWQDNLFNHPIGLEKHLDLLQSVGGNYVRNVMSHRNIGNVFPYNQIDGKFDLNSFNEEYWNRFKDFLDICYQRDIIVQIEIWDPWDHYEDHQSFGGWSHHPFNPLNNSTYTIEESGLPAQVDYAPRSEPTNHSFFRTVPSLDNNMLVLKYQTDYINHLLSIALQYPNVLYCVNNESGERLEWSDFWADHIRMLAKREKIEIQITEMRRREDIRTDDHHRVFDNPERYSFLDISQNNAWSGLGQKHYDNIMYVREYISGRPRPINNIKNYGATRHGEEESVARFCRIVFAGISSARFHRPHPLETQDAHEAQTDFGLGLSPRAQSVIQSMRMVTNELNLIATTPKNDLLSDREENEAYLLAEVGKKYALYFPKGGGNGLVTLDLTAAKGKWQLKWLNITKSNWSDQIHVLEGDKKVQITRPDDDHWAALIVPVD